jgi:hypothetical protein
MFCLQEPGICGPFEHMHTGLCGPFVPVQSWIKLHCWLHLQPPPQKLIKSWFHTPQVVIMIGYFKEQLSLLSFTTGLLLWLLGLCTTAGFHGTLCLVTSLVTMVLVLKRGLDTCLRVRASACHPAANGVVESVVAVNNMLERHVNSHPMQWVQSVHVMRQQYWARVH